MAIEEKLNQTAPPAPDPALDCHSSPTGAGAGAEDKTMANETKPVVRKLSEMQAAALAAVNRHPGYSTAELGGYGRPLRHQWGTNLRDRLLRLEQLGLVRQEIQESKSGTVMARRWFPTQAGA